MCVEAYPVAALDFLARIYKASNEQELLVNGQNFFVPDAQPADATLQGRLDEVEIAANFGLQKVPGLSLFWSGPKVFPSVLAKTSQDSIFYTVQDWDGF